MSSAGSGGIVDGVWEEAHQSQRVLPIASRRTFGDIAGVAAGLFGSFAKAARAALLPGVSSRCTRSTFSDVLQRPLFGLVLTS